MQIRVDGRAWRVEFVPARGLADRRGTRDRDGYCDFEARTIRLWTGLQRTPAELLETALHEFLHGAAPEHGEEWVDHTAWEAAQFLLKLFPQIAEVKT